MMGLLVEEGTPDCIPKALDLGARQLCPKFEGITPQFVEAAHRADLQVVTWTVNSPQDMRSTIAAGVDGIMTDFPDRLRALIQDSQDRP
jgi:glycerophosphoryl diester phosphodiesterase